MKKIVLKELKELEELFGSHSYLVRIFFLWVIASLLLSLIPSSSIKSPSSLYALGMFNVVTGITNIVILIILSIALKRRRSQKKEALRCTKCNTLPKNVDDKFCRKCGTELRQK